jgi:phage FluMu protein Com
MMMQSRNVTMDFTCCGCGQPVSVTVICSGKGLYASADALAEVNVPCPSCGQVNQLHFEPSGTVHAVAPYPAPRSLPEPSIN